MGIWMTSKPAQLILDRIRHFRFCLPHPIPLTLRPSAYKFSKVGSLTSPSYKLDAFYVSSFLPRLSAFSLATCRPLSAVLSRRMSSLFFPPRLTPQLDSFFFPHMAVGFHISLLRHFLSSVL